MSLGDLAALIGLLAAALALLNEHDRRIWLAPWKPTWAWGSLASLLICQAYFLTAETWTKLHLVVPALVAWNDQTVSLSSQQWAVLPFVGAITFVLIRTYWSSLATEEIWLVLQDQWAVRDYGYLMSRLPKFQRSTSFLSGMRNGKCQFLANRDFVTHCLHHRPQILLDILKALDTSRTLPWIREIASALARERTHILDDFLRNFWDEEESAERPTFPLIHWMGRKAPSDLWAWFSTDQESLPGAKTGWGTRQWVGEETDDSLFDQECGRLAVSRVALAYACVLPTGAFAGKWNDVGGYLEGVLLTFLGEFEVTKPSEFAQTSWDDRNDRSLTKPVRGQHAAIFCIEWILVGWSKGRKTASSSEEQVEFLRSMLGMMAILLQPGNGMLTAEHKYLADLWIRKICQSELPLEVIKTASTRNDFIVLDRKRGIARRLWRHHPEDFGETANMEYRARLDALNRPGFGGELLI